MTLHLIYKEWIKTRWFALVALVTALRPWSAYSPASPGYP